MLQLSGIEDFVESRRRGRAFEVLGEVGYLGLELLDVAERGHVEYRHEAAVVVSSGRVVTEAQSREDAGQYLHHDGKAVPLVALWPAEREHRASAAQVSRIGGRVAVFVQYPIPPGLRSPLATATPSFPAATALVAMSMNIGPSRLDGIAMQIGFVPSLGSRPPNGTTDLAERPESAVIMPIIPFWAAMIG